MRNIRRFILQDEQFKFADPFITSLSDIYTAYWRASLLDPKREKKVRKKLISGLVELAKSEGRKATLFETLFKPNIQKLELFLSIAASGKGYYIIMGQTAPLRELLIWKKEDREVHNVELPSDCFTVNVVFVQEVLLRGWLGYATFNRSSNGGWYINDTIYCVVNKKPDYNSEYFRVTILAHEGRHMSDQKRYKIPNSWTLEYRAKLTELLVAETSFWDRLKGYMIEAQDNDSIPHSFASYQLVNNLIRELTQEKEIKSFRSFPFEDYSKEAIKEIAEHLLETNTRSLKKMNSSQQ